MTAVPEPPPTQPVVYLRCSPEERRRITRLAEVLRAEAEAAAPGSRPRESDVLRGVLLAEAARRGI